MSEQVDVIRINDEVEISIKNGGAGGWIRFDIHQISQVLGRLHEIRAQHSKEETEELKRESEQLNKNLADFRKPIFRTEEY